MSIGSYDVFTEHDHLHRLVDRVEAWLERREQQGAEWLSELRTRLEQLISDLGPHFQGEETAIFHDIRTRIPRLIAPVDRLIEQHRRMEKDFSGIGSLVKHLSPDDSSTTDEVAEQIAKVIRLLRVHEQQEIELILTAYGQDLGEPY